MKLGAYEVTIRRSRPDERAWICDAWIHDWVDRHPNYTKREAYSFVNALYVSKGFTAKVAEVEGSPPILVGFVVTMDGEELWCFVSKQFRGNGIAAALKEAS
jgi:hypothetical protein